MSTYNIEMNMLNSSNGYDVLYPKTDYNNLVNIPNVSSGKVKMVTETYKYYGTGIKNFGVQLSNVQLQNDYIVLLGGGMGITDMHLNGADKVTLADAGLNLSSPKMQILWSSWTQNIGMAWNYSFSLGGANDEAEIKDVDANLLEFAFSVQYSKDGQYRDSIATVTAGGTFNHETKTFETFSAYLTDEEFFSTTYNDMLGLVFNKQKWYTIVFIGLINES